MTPLPKVLVLGATAEDPPPGIELVQQQVEVAFATDTEGVHSELPSAEIAFVENPRSFAPLLEEAWPTATALRWIQAAAAGVERLLFPALVESDVVVTNARGVFDQAMAEYVIGLMSLFAKGFVATVDRQRRREWEGHDTEKLEGRHVLVVGVGPIGRAIGRAAAALGTEVRGVGRNARGGDDVFDVVLGVDELRDALEWADWVVDVLPETAETHHVFDAAAFASMRPSARFVNVGRGSTVDEDALVEALERRTIAGAALDVFEEEPLPTGSPLWAMPNVIVSPHVGGDFGGWREAVVELFVENLVRYLDGRPLRGVVDKRLGFVAG